MTDLEAVRRALVLDPRDPLARAAYRDAWIDAGLPECNFDPTLTLEARPDEFLGLCGRGHFARFPVARVRLVGLFPFRTGWAKVEHAFVRDFLAGDPHGGASWRLGGVGVHPQPHEVPEPLADVPTWLAWRARGLSVETPGREAVFRSDDDALAALSDACVWHGREAAGLPQLEGPTP